MLSEISQRDIYYIILLLCGIKKSKIKNKQNRNKLINRVDNLVIALGVGDGQNK